MLRRDILWIGLALGVVLPVMAYFLLVNVFALLDGLGAADGTGLNLNFRERTLTLLAICVNLLPFRAYNNLRATQAMRGVLLATGFYTIAWIIEYGLDLLNN